MGWDNSKNLIECLTLTTGIKTTLIIFLIIFLPNYRYSWTPAGPFSLHHPQPPTMLQP